MKRTCPLLLFSLLAVSCTNAPVQQPSHDWMEEQNQRDRAPGVTVQYCLWEPRLGGVEIRRLGIGTMGATEIGTTAIGQLVFETHLGILGEFTAAVVEPLTLGRTEARDQHVFKANRSQYPEAGWSKWMGPDYISRDENAMFKILNGAWVPKESNARVRILARYKVESFLQFLDAHRGINLKPKLSNLDPCPIDR